MSIRKRDEHEKDVRYLHLVIARREDIPDDKTAQKLRFGSAQAMYRFFANEPSYPVCPECGESPVEKGHCEPSRRRAPAKGTGDIVDLPPADRAAGIFTAALESASAEVTHLERRREHLENERFMVRQEWVLGYEMPQERTSLGRLYTDAEGNERWELEEAAIAPGEASPVPPEPLTSLIAVAALRGTPKLELVEALHPNPKAVDEARLGQAVEALKKTAGEVATLVRGGRVRSGPHTEGLKSVEHAVALYARRRRREGASHKDVYVELRDGALRQLPEGLTEERVKWLSENAWQSWRLE